MKQMMISIETTTMLILCAGNSRIAWCPVCGAEVQMFELSTPEIPALDQLPLEVHRSEAPDGAALICLNSLLARVQTAATLNGGPQRLPKT